MQPSVAVLGSIEAADELGVRLDLRGPRHRALLGRLVAARGRSVPASVLVESLWGDEPPVRAIGTIRTFVGDLRNALEPGRPRGAAARLLVTEGDGYALRLAAHAVDAARFEDALGSGRTLTPAAELRLVSAALGLWRGTPYAEAGDAAWAVEERYRLAETRDAAVERRGELLCELGRPDEAVAPLRTLLASDPLRERAWLALAHALHDAGRTTEAIATVREAVDALRSVGLDPGAALDELLGDLLHRSPRPTTRSDPFSRAATASGRLTDAHSRLRLESTVALLRTLAVSGGAGLAEARVQRAETIDAIERLGDPALSARVIGGFDVPSIWPRSDDPGASATIAAAALRALDGVPEANATARARLYAVVATELRGTRSPAAPRAAAEAVRLARRLGDPELLCFALSSAVVQACARPGRSRERAALGDEIAALGRRHDLPTFEVHGELTLMQAATAVGDLAAARQHAAEVDRLAELHERPLAQVFTRWNAVARRVAAGVGSVEAASVEVEYRALAADLFDAGMPGVEEGLLALALAGVRAADTTLGDLHAGAYDAWLAPLRAARAGDLPTARALLDDLAAPPPGLLIEALWCLTADAAAVAGHAGALRRAREALEPARDEIAGGATGMLVVGPVRGRLEL